MTSKESSQSGPPQSTETEEDRDVQSGSEAIESSNKKRQRTLDYVDRSKGDSQTETVPALIEEPSSSTTVGADDGPAGATSTAPQREEQVPETTVYCDACGKARVLKTSYAETFDLTKEWTCTLVCVNGCAQPDDELENIAGEMFARVLDAIGIKTRKDLANSNSEDYDSGPWSAYIIDWIGKARQEELYDAMREILDGDDELVKSLASLGIETPADIIKADASFLVSACAQAMETSPDEVDALVSEWKTKAKAIADAMPWMYEVETEDVM